MKINILDLIDFNKVDALLEGFNKSTGFVTAILDLEGNVLSKSGWRQICTEFHRINPDTSKKCTISDTELANKIGEGEKYHFYKCLNGLVDVAVPIVLNGEHVANLFSGQFFIEEPDSSFFKKQAEKYGFDEEKYLAALKDVPVVSEEKVKTAMDFLLDMTQLISEVTYQKLEQTELNKNISESEEKFKDVFESANVGKSITLPTGEISVNQAFCKMLGYTREELQNKKWQDITPEDEIAAIQAFTNPLLKGKKDSVRFEKRYICKNGTYIWADVSVSIRRDKNGKPLHFITTIIDISERKNHEKALKDEKDRIRTILDIVGDPIFVKDNQHRITMANQAFFKMFATDKNTALGKTLAELVPEKEKNHFLQVDRNVLDTGIQDSREEELTINNETKTIITKKIRFTDDSGNNFLVGSIHDISYLKRNEEVIKESEKKYRLLFESNPQPMWVYDIETLAFLSVNDAAVLKYGYSKEEFLQMTIKDIRPPEDILKLLNNVKSVTSGINEAGVWSHYKKDESIIFVEITSYVFDYEGKRAELILSNDITEKLKAEEKLRESESRFRKLYEDGANGMVMASKDFKFLMANKTFCKMIGYEEEELKQLTFVDITHSDDKAKDSAAVKKMMAGDVDVYRTEKRYVRKDGQAFWAQLTVSPIYDSNGRFLYFVGIIVNITERKNAELDLIRMSQIMKNSQEIAHLGSFEYIAATQTTIWSEEEYRIYGLDPSGPSPEYNEMLEKCIHPDDAKLLHDTFVLAMQNRRIYELEHRIVRPDGGVRWVYDKAHPYFDEKGNLVRYVGATLDITERKRTEEEFVAAKEKAEESNRLKTAFLQNMSHEIRTPMNGILGFIELLKNPTLTGEKREEFIEIVQISGERLLTTINDIIEFSRIESGEVEVIQKGENIEDILNNHFNFFIPEIEKRGLFLKVNYQHVEKNTRVLTDRFKLDSIFINLIKNAVKFTKQGSIEIGCYRDDDDLVFYVKDTGIGIPANRKEAIFERFVQSDLTITRGYEGSGLGLSISKAYSEMLGGKIWLDSVENTGTTFYFSIPYKTKNQDVTVISKPSDDKPVRFDSSLKILIAEDDENSFLFLETILSGYGIVPMHAGNGEEAIRALKNSPDIDIILMDLKMPTMDGIEATKQIRHFNKAIPIIAQTAYAFSSDKEKATEAGCNAYISKPIKVSELISMIQQFTKNA